MKPYEKEKVTVHRECGHDEEVEIRQYKKEVSRQSKIKKLEKEVCWACYVKETREQFALVPMRMHYSEYKYHYGGCLVDGCSYDQKTKMITVYVRPEHKPQDDMVRYLTENCEISLEQAGYLARDAGKRRYWIQEWFEMTPGSEAFLKALRLIEENEPSHYYVESKIDDYDDDDMPF